MSCCVTVVHITYPSDEVAQLVGVAWAWLLLSSWVWERPVARRLEEWGQAWRRQTRVERREGGKRGEGEGGRRRVKGWGEGEEGDHCSGQ